MKKLKPYKGVCEIFSTYWNSYGGIKGLIGSFYLHLSVIVSIACYPIWSPQNGDRWFELPIAIIPNLLGFTLGGYAILLAFGNDDFMKSIAGPEEDGTASPYIEVNAAFIHFILIQTLSLFISLVASAWKFENFLIRFVCFMIFIYALASLVAAAMAIFRVANWFDTHIGNSQENDNVKDGKSEE